MRNVKVSLFPIENEADLNKRYADIGLTAMADYIAIISDVDGEAAVPAAGSSKLTGDTAKGFSFVRFGSVPACRGNGWVFDQATLLCCRERPDSAKSGRSCKPRR